MSGFQIPAVHMFKTFIRDKSANVQVVTQQMQYKCPEMKKIPHIEEVV